METMTYETSATSHAANDLVLAVLNESTQYRLRCDLARLDMEGEPVAGAWRDMVREEAAVLTARFGTKYTRADIHEAAKLVRAASIQHVQEAA